MDISSAYQEKLEELEKEAKTVVFLAVDNEIKGLLALQDIPKGNAKLAISQLKKRGLKTVMLTGDNAGVARAIADQIGIEEVIAGVLPEEKAHEIHKLQAAGKVAFVGDGINDSPVIKRADIGLSMGALGSDAAIEASDIVIMDDRIEKIVNIFDTSHFVNKIILENLIFTGFVKAAIIILSLFIQLPLWLAVFGDVGVTLISVINTLRIR